MREGEGAFPVIYTTAACARMAVARGAQQHPADETICAGPAHHCAVSVAQSGLPGEVNVTAERLKPAPVARVSGPVQGLQPCAGPIYSALPFVLFGRGST